MTDHVPTPTSITDPYPAETSETQDVLCLLRRADGTDRLVPSDRRVLQPHAVVLCAGRVYTAAGDDERSIAGRKRWVKIFVERPTVRL